jgi:hypothetical protein
MKKYIDKKNSFRNNSILFLFIAAVIASCFMVGCQEEEDAMIEDNMEYIDFIGNTPNSSLEINDFRDWLNSQKIANEFIGEQEPNWDNAEIKILQDSSSQLVSFEIYKGKNLSGNDSIRELQVAYVKNSFTGGVKVYSFYNEEIAHVKYYSLSGQILEEGEYYAPKQLYSLTEIYTVERGIVRLKSGSESDDPCEGTEKVSNSATPSKINGVYNPDAYNCHAYVWGYLSSNHSCYEPHRPKWNNCPNISGSRVSVPQVGDRWVSYGYVSGKGTVPIHSAIVIEVKNGKVTRLRAKCGDKEIYFYHPDCNKPLFAPYKTNDVRYYRM